MRSRRSFVIDPCERPGANRRRVSLRSRTTNGSRYGGSTANFEWDGGGECNVMTRRLTDRISAREVPPAL
jgi:hypothetical protein